MSLVITRNRSILAAALLIPFAGSIWLIFSRTSMSSSRFAAFVALFVAIAAVGLNTWHNGRAAGSIGQVIYEADVAPATARTEGTGHAR
jgi:hypothetical protein